MCEGNFKKLLYAYVQLRPILNLCDVPEVDELSEPQFTDHTCISTSGFSSSVFQKFWDIAEGLIKKKKNLLTQDMPTLGLNPNTHNKHADSDIVLPLLQSRAVTEIYSKPSDKTESSIQQSWYMIGLIDRI